MGRHSPRSYAHATQLDRLLHHAHIVQLADGIALSGALPPMVAAHPGDVFEATVTSFGPCVGRSPHPGADSIQDYRVYCGIFV